VVYVGKPIACDLTSLGLLRMVAPPPRDLPLLQMVDEYFEGKAQGI